MVWSTAFRSSVSGMAPFFQKIFSKKKKKSETERKRQNFELVIWLMLPEHEPYHTPIYRLFRKLAEEGKGRPAPGAEAGRKTTERVPGHVFAHGRHWGLMRPSHVANRSNPLYTRFWGRETMEKIMRVNLCRHCGKQFKFRRGKLYCSDKCRIESWKTTASPCFYCGCPAETIDHVPPRAARKVLQDLNISRFPFVEVEACHECNCALTDNDVWTLPERKAFIKRWIAKRYKKYLESPAWTDEEKAGLGRGLLTAVSESEIIAELTCKRLRW